MIFNFQPTILSQSTNSIDFRTPRIQFNVGIVGMRNTFPYIRAGAYKEEKYEAEENSAWWNNENKTLEGAVCKVTEFKPVQETERSKTD